ncbi:MAG: argininosuccinate lyase [Candidatus Marinimicrobia bacterium]|nr:argininosuccinate lyase [Candidatus Neomarinimicrobiota bacterium]
MKLWKKNIHLDEKIENYTVGTDYLLDNKLLKYDCLASIAHAKMLHKINILTEDEKNSLIAELETIIRLHEKGEFNIQKSDEDCHTAIENHLTEKLGEAGKKIHTARSRNDQVLTALRLYYLDNLDRIQSQIHQFQKTLKQKSRVFDGIKIPGFTHTRKAMVTSVDVWVTAFRDAMTDNLKFLKYVKKIVSQSPLGTGAGYGIPLKTDRQFTSDLLGFQKPQKNPIYTQNSRGKFEALVLSLLSTIMFDLNKMASDLILFSMPGLDFFKLPDEFTTGSSIMPQKKNPDVMEIMRGNYHKVLSLEMRVKSMMSNLIMGYHRDFQLFKEAVMEAFDVTCDSLNIADHVMGSLSVNQDVCEQHIDDEVCATEKVYRLVEKGIPFRDAYRTIAEEFHRGK